MGEGDLDRGGELLNEDVEEFKVWLVSFLRDIKMEDVFGIGDIGGEEGGDTVMGEPLGVV